MLQNVVPIIAQELYRLSEIGSTGFVIGFGLRYGQPDYFENRYPKSWTDIYEEENYFFGDPVAAWTIARTGVTRWSEIKFPDPRGIMSRAKDFGIKYGATTVTKIGKKRSFMSLARSDRELNDHELSYVHDRIQLWAKMFAQAQVSLTDEELTALSLLSEGMAQEDAATKLGISRSTFKSRVVSAQKKLGATKANQAIARAVRQNLI